MGKADLQDGTQGSAKRWAKFVSTHRPFIVVWLALLISMAGIGMASPLLPVFAEEMGADGIWLGLAFSGFAFTQIPLTPIVGQLSDRLGKKLFIWSGLLVYTAAAAGYFWSPTYHEVVIFRVFSGLGAAMVIPTAFAYIGELVPGGYEGRHMGVFSIATTVAGFGLGPLLGGVVYDSFGMDAAFISMGILSVLGSLIVVLFLPGRTSRTTGPSGETGLSKPLISFIPLLKDEAIRGIISFQLAYGLLSGAVLAFVGIWMTEEIGTSVAQVGIVLSARVVTNAIVVYPFGWLADRVNRVVLATVGLTIVAIGTLCIPWLGSFTQLVGLFLAVGVFEGMSIPPVNAITVEKGRTMGMGSVMGMSNMAMPLGLIVGSMGGGVIESSMGIAAVFRCAAALGCLGIVLFTVFMLRSDRAVEKLTDLQTSASPLIVNHQPGLRDQNTKEPPERRM